MMVTRAPKVIRDSRATWELKATKAHKVTKA